MSLKANRSLVYLICMANRSCCRVRADTIRMIYHVFVGLDLYYLVHRFRATYQHDR